MVSSILPLEVAGACVRKRGAHLVGPVDLTLTGKGISILMGPNGSGKTTLLRLLHGLERPATGSLRWSAPATEARQRQAYVFQTPIMMRRSVLDSIAYPMTLHGERRARAREMARDWAERVGIGHAIDRHATVLSGGEKQKLALARALIRQPDVLFLDEPCANLDGRATREIEAILTRARDEGVRIVMATHDMGQARRLADEVLFLLKGRLHSSGPADTFFSHPRTPEAKAFLNGDILE
ncbi:sulfate ABC transporter ATP-binding protein [Brevirhabdus pacifica]|uniref:Sulfate ABC transporter ATP-binding protein n=1 Tax=Brevirhabdus pacifica TaxID=1267768 RepID=A0A1U7DKH7_9RHOB|nr:ATP-binding cassette domain-containing protein [Brevirhabdus pacifica]APX90504.1 sulfate ABC transporter ATP-binding protein [Brevirhabdus pacifica]OWU78484.1 sulfate ABC transporter ATP-binding protein [Loktanella sp. 22II-4b]PJJ85382.1 tungstate transport system ATP-binding protein [Brevirhabdus pacifica]